MALSYSVLKNRSFRHLISTRLFAVFALQFQDVIINWQIYTLTKSAFCLGLVGLTEAIPAIGFALVAGHIVDKSRPHFILRNCLIVLCLISLVMLLVAGGHVGASDRVIIAVLFVGIFFSGLVRSFIMPSSFTLLARIVPRSDIPAATSWMTSGFQLAAITGPALAGIIFGMYGSTIAWYIPFFFLVGSVIAIGTMQKEHRLFKNVDSREPVLKSIAAGWNFVIRNRIMLPIMTLDMFAVLFGGAVAILPVFIDQRLHLGSEWLGLLRAAPAAGSIITALYFALNPMKTMRGSVLLYVITGFGICILGFGLSTSFLPAAFFLALSGAFDSVSMIIRGTIMQLLIPDAMRGRVSALNSMFIISSNEIGAFESGTAASLLGLIPSIIMGGCMTLLIVGITAVKGRELRALVIHTDKKESG